MTSAMTALRSCRLYLWPAITLNTALITYGITDEWLEGLILGIGLSLLASNGFLLNDLFDRQIDRDNGAHRLESASPAELRLALGLVGVTAILSLLCGAFVGRQAIWLLATLMGCLATYTFALRRVLFLATLMSAFVGISPIWLPVVLWGPPRPQLFWVAVSAFYVFYFAREVVLDIKDREGDRLGERATFPTVFGSRIALLLVVFLALAGGLALVFVQSTVNRTNLPLLYSWIALIAFLSLNIFPAALCLIKNGDRSALAQFISASRLAMLIAPLLLYLTFLS